MDYSNIRHQLHELAEPSGEEKLTHHFILKMLEEYPPTHLYAIPNSYSLVAEYSFSNNGKTILFRGDMDAVSVEETIELPYSSHRKEVAHKCGHDGHTTILIGLARQLTLKPLKTGKVLLFFQASEENGKGAEALLASNLLTQFHIDKVFALHNIPGYPLNSVICKSNSFTCSVISCDIHLMGKTAHAAEPLNAVSPTAATINIIQQILSWNQYNICNDNYAISTLIEAHIGETAYGVAAGNSVIRWTIRTKTDSLLKTLQKKIEELVGTIVMQTEGLHYQIEWLEYFAATHNNTEAVEQIKNTTQQLNLTYIDKDVPFSWGEDFGLLTQQYSGAMFGLGSGENCFPLHHPHYDFPDEIIPTAISLFYNIATHEQ